MTYVTAIDSAINGVVTDEVREKLEALKASIAKRSASKSSTPTKRQKENEGVKARIAEVLSDEGKTVTQILAEMGDASLTNQRVSALLRQMGTRKEMVKGKALFFAE
jgi:uncharacterized membrane protein YheB (UPF0754 family)